MKFVFEFATNINLGESLYESGKRNLLGSYSALVKALQ